MKSWIYSLRHCHYIWKHIKMIWKHHLHKWNMTWMHFFFRLMEQFILLSILVPFFGKVFSETCVSRQAMMTDYLLLDLFKVKKKTYNWITIPRSFNILLRYILWNGTRIVIFWRPRIFCIKGRVHFC